MHHIEILTVSLMPEIMNKKCAQVIINAHKLIHKTYIPLQFHSVLMMSTGSNVEEHTKDLRAREWIHAQTCLMIPVGPLWFHLSLFLSLSHHCLHIISANQTRGFLTWRTHNLRVTVPVPSQWAPSRICSITPDSYHSATPTRGEGGGEEKNSDVLIHPLNQLRSVYFSSSAPSGGLICTAGPEREGLARLQVWDNQASGLKRIRLAFLNSHIFIRAKISNWNLIKKDEP